MFWTLRYMYMLCVWMCFLHVRCGEMRQVMAMQRLAKMRTHVPIVQGDLYYLGCPVTVRCWSLLEGICDVSNSNFQLSTPKSIGKSGYHLYIYIYRKRGILGVHMHECWSYTGCWDTLEQNDAMLSGTPKKNIGEPSRASTNLQTSWNTWSLDVFDVQRCQQFAYAFLLTCVYHEHVCVAGYSSSCIYVYI